MSNFFRTVSKPPETP